MRAAVVAVVTAALIPLSQTVTAESASAKPRQHPRSFTGYAFDTCDAPSQRSMNRWLKNSRYWGVGIYVAGMNRACSSQPNLTRGWVQRQSHQGWRLLPIVVGRQASCSPPGYYRGKRISADPSGRYREARRQGHRAADGAVKAVKRLGIARGSTIWYDLEHFDVTRNRCRTSALAFTSSWTRQLRDLGYRSGFYSSASSGIRMVADARNRKRDGWATPDQIWFAEWNNQDSVRSAYISSKHWWPRARVHQFRGGHTERYGGAPINIDSNFMSVGKGSRAGKQAPHCGVRISYRSYRTVERGDRGAKVRAAQCLLRQQKAYGGRLHGRYTKAVGKAVRKYQRGNDLGVTGTLGRSTWTVLLSDGPRRLLKFGSGNDAMRRLQRSLNASTGARLKVDGVFGRRDLVVVKGFQKRAGLPTTGVVTGRTWRKVHNGAVVGRLPRQQGRSSGLLAGLWPTIPFSSGARPR